MPARVVQIAFTGSTAELEASLRRAGLVAEESGSKIGGAFTAGTEKAGGAISKLGQTAGSWGIPFAASLQTIGKHLDETKSKTDKLHASLSEAGKVTLLAGGAGLAAVATEAVKLGQSYETAQAAIQGATGQSVKSAGALTKAFQATAGSSMESGQHMEQAYAAVAGQLKLTEGHALSTAEAMKFSAAANSLAESGAANLTEAYGATAKMLAVFHLNADHASEATDTLYSVSKALNMPVESVATAMARLHGRLGDVAPSLRDVSGLMVDLGPKMGGTRGLNAISSSFQTLLGGSKKVAETLHNLGVSVYDSNGKFVGMQSVIGQLQPKFAGLDDAQKHFVAQTLFGKGAAELMTGVIQRGVPAFDQASAAANRHGAAVKAAGAQQKTFHGEMQTLKATVETLGGSLGLILIPKITAVAKALAEGIQWLEKHKAAAIALGSVIAGVLGTAVAVFAYDKAVAFGKGVQRMVSGLGSLVGSSATTAAAVEADQAAQAAAVEAASARIAAANAAAAATFEELGPAAVAGGAQVDTAVATEAAAVGAADTAIEADNVAAGRSFTALLGPIAAAVAAAWAASEVLNKVLPAGSRPENLLGGNQPGEAEQEGQRPGSPFSKMNQRGSTGQGTLGQSNQYPFISQIAERYGVSPHTLWGIYGTETSYGGNINTSSTGAKGAFQFEPGTAKTYGYPLTNHPNSKQFEEQAAAAARYIQANTHKYGSEAKAVEAYYAGHPGGQGEYLAKVEQAGGAHYGKAQEEEAKKAQDEVRHLQAAAGQSNAAIQQQMEEASGAKPKKGKKAPGEPYVEPFTGASGLTRSRTDQGVDFSFAGPLAAIGAGTIVKIIQDPGGFGTEIVEKLTQGARKGQYIYSGLETGAVSRVHEGQQVRAGQEIAHGLGKGGVELGFASGPGGVPITPYAPGASHGTPTAGGQAFSQFIASIGKGGTVLSQVTKAAEAAEKAEAKRLATLEAAAKKLLGEGQGRGNLESAIQSGGVSQLERILGVSTGGRTGTQLSRELGGGAPLTQATLEHTIMPTLAKSAAGTPTGKAFDQMVAQLRATHQAGLAALADRLVQAHKQALANLGRELYAATQEKEGQRLSNLATEEKDRTQQAANTAARQLDIVKAANQREVNAMQGATKQIEDASTAMKDSMAAAAEAIQLRASLGGEQGAAQVLEVKDAATVRVAELQERGKYGLDLIAQKLEVQLDQMKASYDIEIEHAKISLDQTKLSEQQLISSKQQQVDLLQAHEDQLIAGATARADAAALVGATDVGTAQGTVDAAQITADARTDAAMTASVIVAGGTKAQQDAARGFEKFAAAKGAGEMAGAEAGLRSAEAQANAANAAAQAALVSAQAGAQQAIAEAQQALARAQGEGAGAIASAEAALTGIERAAAIAEAGLEAQLEIKRAEAQTQYAGSGLVVNQYGINPQDANANAAAIGWALRTRIPA